MESIRTWHYDNHRLLPSCAPHQRVDENYILTGQCWRDFPKAVCATYTSSFDIPQEIPWYYVIKDSPFDLSKLKAKKRYEITKGNKSFYVEHCDNPLQFKEELYQVYKESILTGYKGEGFKVDSYDVFCKWLSYMGTRNNRGAINQFFIVYKKSDSTIGGYGHILQYSEWAAFSTMKTIPRYEKDGVNAALCYGILEYLNVYLEQDGFYFSDGSRTIFHKTAFQDYLQKYFDFRKAYAKLEMAYNPRYNLLIKMLFPIRKVIERLSGLHHSFYGIASMLTLEEYYRACKKTIG